MMDYQFDLVGKIGSMALIRKEDKDIDYNIFSRLGAELKPGMIWVTSGATEIGRLDYLKRTGCELCGSDDEIKADYAAQGQSILMQNYRQFIHQEYGVRQFEVLKYRLENEYNVEIRMETLPYEYIRWIENKDIDLNKLVGTSDMKKIKDLKGNPLLLWVNSWSIGMTLDRNEGLVLTEFGRN